MQLLMLALRLVAMDQAQHHREVRGQDKLAKVHRDQRDREALPEKALEVLAKDQAADLVKAKNNIEDMFVIMNGCRACEILLPNLL